LPPGSLKNYGVKQRDLLTLRALVDHHRVKRRVGVLKPTVDASLVVYPLVQVAAHERLRVWNAFKREH
jgi:hypothetical protein